MTNNLFDNNPLELVDPNKDYYSELVGEGKKYKTPQDLGRSKYEADLTIKNRETELAESRAMYAQLREEYVAAKKLEELLDQYQLKSLASNEDTQKNVNEVNKQTAFDPKEIESLVSSKISEYETTKRQTENFNLVSKKVQERYGENHKAVLKQQMEQMGLSEEYVNNLARTAPQAFLKLFEVDQKQSSENQFQTPPRSDRRSDNFAPNVPKRTWSYYEELKKKDPTLYLNPKTQNQMMQDAAELGEAFKDGDFYKYG